MPYRLCASRAAAASVLAVGGDLLVHRLPRPVRPVAGYGLAFVLLAVARSAGASWEQLGLAPASLRAGARTGAAAGGCAAVVLAASVAMPRTRRYLRDERARAAAGAASLAVELARITLVAVPPEELIYRSGLPALLPAGSPGRSAAGTLAWSSALFGMSHVAPTLATMHHSVLHQHLAASRPRVAAFVAANVLVTALAGGVFGWLRLRSGSVLASLIAHAVVNDGALIAGLVADALAGQAPEGADHQA